MRKLSGRNDKVYCTNVEEATETTPGNPKFLDLLLNVQQRRAKMLGLDAPIKIDIPNGIYIIRILKDGDPVQVQKLIINK